MKKSTKFQDNKKKHQEILRKNLTFDLNWFAWAEASEFSRCPRCWSNSESELMWCLKSLLIGSLGRKFVFWLVAVVALQVVLDRLTLICSIVCPLYCCCKQKRRFFSVFHDAKLHYSTNNKIAINYKTKNVKIRWLLVSYIFEISLV